MLAAPEPWHIQQDAPLAPPALKRPFWLVRESPIRAWKRLGTSALGFLLLTGGSGLTQVPNPPTAGPQWGHTSHPGTTTQPTVVLAQSNKSPYVLTAATGKSISIQARSQTSSQFEREKLSQGWWTLGISALGLLATVTAGVGFWFNYLLERRKAITERFTKAIEQLAGAKSAEAEDDMTMRIGAIYALEGVANDAKEMSWTVMQTLASYIRRRSPFTLTDEVRVLLENTVSNGRFDLSILNNDSDIYQLTDGESNKQPTELALSSVTPDIQVALDVLARRKQKDPKGQRLNLSKTNLYKANLRGANLKGANLTGANLMESNLREAFLDGASLRRTNLFGADLRKASLSSTLLSGADFRGAFLSGADFRGSDLLVATLGGSMYNAKPLNALGQQIPLQPTQFPPGFDPKGAGMVEKNTWP